MEPRPDPLQKTKAAIIYREVPTANKSVPQSLAQSTGSVAAVLHMTSNDSPDSCHHGRQQNLDTRLSGSLPCR